MSEFRSLIFMSIIALAFVSCKDEDEPTPTADFTVTIENAFEAKDFFAAGGTGFIAPGESASYMFDAGKGHHISFATMYVQSNDLFYATPMVGLALYDADGNATTGDITDQLLLLDAGTEVNEEPGVGANQAPRQAGANTGDDENGVVRPISAVDDGFTYPANSDVLNVTLAHDGGTRFTLTIDNVSGSSALPSPVAPGVWVVHGDGQTPIYQGGEAASAGLEAIAEDGNNEMMNNNLTGRSGLVSPFAPGAYLVTDGENTLWMSGSAPSTAIENLAEDGNPGGFENAFNTPTGASGSEVDEYPGAGNNQAPRQAGMNTGADENGTVEREAGSFDNLPAVSDMIRITIQ